MGDTTKKKEINLTPTAAPDIDDIPTLKGYESTRWEDTTKGQDAYKGYTDALGAVENQDPFVFSQADWLQTVMDDIKNYGQFSYDINGDALYQQYKDKYIQQGKMAMADTMGQAAAMTGGYGNSYAASVGNQAYQSHLQNLNDVIPELYQLALDRWNMGKEDLYNQYGMLSAEHDREYGMHQDEYNKLMDMLGIKRSDYYDGANLHYTEQSNKNSVIGMENNDTMSIWQANTDQKWKQAEWEEAIRQAVNSDIWNANADERAAEAWDLEKKGKTYSGRGTTTTGTSYNNEGYSDADVMKAQAFLGVSQDGKWGANSIAAANRMGYANLAEVMAAMGGGSRSVETKNTTAFMNSITDKSRYLASGKSESDYNEYVMDKLASYLRSGRLTEGEVEYLIEQYGLE